MPKPRVVIIGAGRMGQGLGLALHRRGYAPILIVRSPRTLPPPLVLQIGELAQATGTAELILIATPDDAIPGVAAELAREEAVRRDQTVLHLSGLLDRRALSALNGGAALGSFHPLQTVADPATAPERLKGAYVGIEGDDRALVAAERLANTLRMIPVQIPATAKPGYHVGAALAANYLAALAGLAERLAAEAGVAPEIAGKIYLPLLSGAVQNITTLGAAQALTGPVRRGDVKTVQAHLAALKPADRRLYRGLALAALELARAAGLSQEAGAEMAEVLKQDGP